MTTLDPNGNTPVGTIVCYHTSEFGDLDARVDQWGYVTEVAAWGYLLIWSNPPPEFRYTGVWVCVGLVDYNLITIGACSAGTQPVTVSNPCWTRTTPSGRVCIGILPIPCTKNINDSDIRGTEVGCTVTVTLTRQATFDLKVNYKKNGAAKTYTIANISHAVGTVNYSLVQPGVFWEVANYTDLTITVQNIR